MTKSENIEKLAAALANAQAVLQGAVKDAANPFFKSKYADLESCWDAAREPLTKNGLAVIQTTGVSPEGGLCLETTLAHSSGQWISGTLPLMPVKNDPQSQGSAITYARRYAFAAIIGLVQVDDDGEGAHGRKPEPAASQRPAGKPSTPPHQPAAAQSAPFDGFHPGSDMAPPLAEPASSGSSTAPVCCGNLMMISQYPDKNFTNPPWYCKACKTKRERTVAA